MLSLDSLQSYLNPVIIVKLLGIKNCSLLCCMASFMSGQEEPNPMLRLVNQAGKMADVTSSGLPAVSRKNNFHESQMIFKSLTKLNWSRWLDETMFFFWNAIDLDSVSVMKVGLISTALSCLICISPQEERLDVRGAKRVCGVYS